MLELGQKIQTEAQSEMEKVQREYFLREQLKAIQRELGERDEQAIEIDEFRQKIEAAQLPEEARKEANRELDRLAKLPTAAAEYGVIRTYLDWLTSLPWSKITPDNLDIQHARAILGRGPLWLAGCQRAHPGIPGVVRNRSGRATAGNCRRPAPRRTPPWTITSGASAKA